MLSFAEIDKGRTGISGVSIGGHLSCTVAGIDDRFKAAASVFGTGFIYQKGLFKKLYHAKLTSEERYQWVNLFDPSNYLEDISCPLLFAGNPNDDYYPIDILIKSYKLLSKNVHLFIEPTLPHDPITHRLRVLEYFFDQHLNNGPSLPLLPQPEIKHNKLYVRSSDVQKNHSAYVYFTTDAEPSDNREWQIYPARIDQHGIVADLPPEGTIACFVNYLVDDHVMVSSKVMIMNNSFYN